MKSKGRAAKIRYAALLKLHHKKRPAKNAFDYYYDEPLDEKAILISGLGLNVRGNMQYILDELNSNEVFSDYRIYVRTDKNSTADIVSDYIKNKGWTRTEIVSENDLRKMEACKYLITEDFFPYKWIKRPGQVVINTWHGVPLKKMGLMKHGDRKHINAKQQKNFLSSDYLMYPNAFTRDIMLEAYGVSNLLNAKILMMGYPRTAGMLSMTEEETAELRRQLAPSGEHIYAYMPTFRGDLSDDEAVARERSILDVLDAGLEDDQILYVNLHHRIKAGISTDGYNHIKLFPPLVDSYSLLAASEALISDYSSVFFDYLATRKHIILHIDDLDDYSGKRGLNLNIKELPFDLAQDASQIPDMLRRGKQYDDSDIYKSLCAYDDPDNAARLCRIISGEEEQPGLQDPPGSGDKKVLLYSDGCFAGRDTTRLRELAELNRTVENGPEIYIGCSGKQVKSDPRGAYPLLNEVPVIASSSPGRLSSIGATLLELYKEGRISFRAAIRYLQYDYALYTKCMYGDAGFDTIGIYDTIDPGMLIGLALGEAPHKMLFISDRMLSEIADGNVFLKDAIGFSAGQCDCVSVANTAAKEVIIPLLNKNDRGKVVIADTAGDMLEQIRK